MGITHADEATLGETGYPTLLVSPAGATHQKTPVHLQLLMVRQDLVAFVTQPLTTFRPNRKASQLGALTRLSFSTVRPATSARNRLYTPAT